MASRVQVAAVQIAVFVGGGVMAPVAHLAGHRPDHTHGPAGEAIAFEVLSPEQGLGPRADVRPPGEDPIVEERRDSEPVAGARHHHAQPHPHSHPHLAEEFEAAEPAAPTRRSQAAAPAGPPPEEAQPLKPTHGHGSLAHLGLALLSAPPPLPLPVPERAGDVEVGASPRVAALFQPGFPLPRPPPAEVTPS